MTAPLLEMRGISKRFPGVAALSDVSLTLHAGEVLALCGENGAGKSTLMKILGGLYSPDAGALYIAGERIRFSGPADAKAVGVALIHQELLLAPDLDVTANLFLGQERRWFPGGPMRFGLMRAAAKRFLEKVGLQIDPATPVRRLTTGQQQMVEIAKALSMDARILVMDEPTSSLTLGESRRLFDMIAALKDSGRGVIYISHRMEEVFRLADRVTVLRDGRNVGDMDSRACTVEQIICKMVGRERGQQFPQRKRRPTQEVIFRATEIRPPGAKHGASFTLARGEILGFAGLVGSGRTELMQVIFGIDQPVGGAMELAGKPYGPKRPIDAIRRGVLLAPEDRKLHGLVLGAAIRENIALPNSAGRFPAAWKRFRSDRVSARSAVQSLGVRAHSIEQKSATLSGGNQQKVVLGKWLSLGPKVLILDEPTRGIDVGAKAEIYRQIADFADAGVSILLVSSEMEELLGLADRVLVLHERKLVGELGRAELSEERLMMMMTGLSTPTNPQR